MKPYHLLFALFAIFSASTHAQSLDYLDHLHLGDGPGLNDEVYTILTYNNGDILTSGRFRGLIDFNIDSNNAVLLNQSGVNGGSFLARYSQSGQLRWLKSVEGAGSAQIQDVTLDQDENIYITGYFSARMTFDQNNPNQTFFGQAPTEANAFVARLDTVGNLVWVRFFMGNSNDTGRKVKINSQNQVIVLGSISQTVVFDPNAPNATIVSAGNADIIVAAYSATDGQFNWVRSIPGLGVDNPRGMTLDSQDNIYIAGDFTSTISFPTNPPTPTVTTGGNDVFIAKFSSNGNFEWGRKIGGTSTDLGADIALSGDTMILVNGTYRFNIQFDHGGSLPNIVTSNSNTNVFVAAYDTSGSYLWNRLLGSSGADRTYNLLVDDSARIWVSGYMVNEAFMDIGQNNVVLAKITDANPFAVAYDLQNAAFSRLISPQSNNFASTEALALSPQGDIWTGGRFRGSLVLDSLPNFSLHSPASNVFTSFWARYSSGFDTAWTTISRGGGTMDGVNKIRHDQFGNLYVAGQFNGRVNFNPIGSPHFVTSLDQIDAFVASYSPSGLLRWMHRIGGPNKDQATALAVDDHGNVLVGGQFFDDIFLPTPNGFDTITAIPTGVFNNPDIFILKLDSTGNVLFSHRLGGANEDIVNDIHFYPNGDYLIGGTFRAGIDFDPLLAGNNTFTANNNAGYFAAYTSTGQYMWHKIINGSSNQFVQGLALDDSLNILVTGAFRNTTNFDLPNSFLLTSNGGSDDVFVAKYSPARDLQWVRGYGQTTITTGVSVETDPSGNVYFAGDFAGTTDFNPGGTPLLITSNGNRDIFVGSLTPNGNLRWIVPFGGAQEDRPMEMRRFGNRIYTTGFFRDAVNMGQGVDTNIRISRGTLDIFVHILDTSGQYINAASFGGPGQDAGLSISHLNGNTFVGGYVSGNANLSTGNFPNFITGFGGQDGIIAKLGNAGPCPPEFDTIVVNQCSAFFWNNEIFTETGSYTRQLFTLNGCDSTVFLDVTINPTFDTIVSVSTCDAVYLWRGQSLTSSGVYRDTLMSEFGCDSIIALDLNLLLPSFDTIIQTVCSEFTWALNNQTYTQSGLYNDTLQNANGCDSVITLDLRIFQPTSSSISLDACSAYTWALNNQTYTQSGLYSDTLQNANGCDSVITLDLRIFQPTSSSISVDACSAYTWALNNQTYTQSGLYVDTLQNANGCDSVVSLNLTITNVDVSVADSVLSLTSLATAATFRWLDCQNAFSPIPGATSSVFTPILNGLYAVEVMQNNCIDTSACYLIDQIGLEVNTLPTMRIFPNPSTGVFTIDLGAIYRDYDIRIIDLNGKIMYYEQGENMQLITKQLQLASGVYTLEVQVANQRRVMRLIIL
jgi:hypothetical protein